MFPLDWLLFIFILLINGGSNNASFLTGCNPIYCFSVLDSLFSVDGEDSCLKAAKLVKCVTPCFPSATENILLEGLKVIEEEVCSNVYQEDSKNANKCLSKQKYAIFSCFYKYFYSEAEDPQVDPKLLKCRIGLNIGMCETLNSPCTSRASYIMQKFFKTFLNQCHGIAGEDITNIHLKFYNFKEYGLLAECLDKNSNLITQCFSKAVSQLSLTSPKNLCRIDVATKCIEHIVLNDCDNRINFFRNISQSLANHILPFCSKTNVTDSLQYKKAEISNSATTLKTESDVSKAEEVTEEAELSSLQTLVSSEAPTIKDLSIDQNDYQFHTAEENSSDFSKRVLKNITTLPTNNSVLSSDSTPTIVIHKHIVMTVSYRAKNEANSVSVLFSLIGVLCLIQYLSTGMLIQ